MKNKIYCPVCQLHFVSQNTLEPGTEVICLICGARLEITEVKPDISARKALQEPEEEIYDRVETYAHLKGYVFEENKEAIMAGLMDKKRRFGDFYCPCRFDNVPENICPCQETRQNAVKKDGSCLCGLFYLPGQVLS